MNIIDTLELNNNKSTKCIYEKKKRVGAGQGILGIYSKPHQTTQGSKETVSHYCLRVEICTLCFIKTE